MERDSRLGVAGMSGQMGKRKEDCVYEAGNDASWCDGR